MTRRRDISAGWTGRRVGWGCVGWVAVALLLFVSPARATDQLRADIDRLREYDAPATLSPETLLIRSALEGTTVIAGTSTSSPPTCTVVVARPEGATAYPYRHTDGGTACLGVAAHPDEGFFVRGLRPDAAEGEPAGVTARIDGNGRELWRVSDSAVAEARSFEGSYLRPGPSIAYSPSSDLTMVFTYGRITVEDLGSETVTHATVVEGDEVLTLAEPLGRGIGFGPFAGLRTMPSSGQFLYYLNRPGSSSTYLARFDGRRAVDEVDLAEEWEDRQLVDVTVTRRDRLALLWAPDDSDSIGITLLEPTGERVWSATYPSAAYLQSDDADRTPLGRPQSLHVGPDHIAVLHGDETRYLRVVDRQTGDPGLVTTLTELVPGRILTLLPGDSRPLRILVLSGDAEHFREYRLEFARPEHRDAGGGGDAAPGDAGPGNDGGNGGGPGPCSCTSPPGGVPALPVVAFGMLAALKLRRR